MDWRKNPEYWGTAGAGIIPVARDTGRFLISLRSRHVNEPNTWGTIGGKLDPIEPQYDEEDWEFEDDPELEDPEDAALREFEEETCSRQQPDLVPLLVFRDDEVGFMYYNFLGVVPHEFEPCVNWETERWRWLTFDELVDLEPKHFGLESVLGDSESAEEMVKRS